MLRDIPLFLVLGIALVWGAPLVEERTAEGVPLGIPIRGYGVMVLVGIVTSTGLLVHQSRRMGLNPDQILSLVFWMVVTGFLGARLFYVIQYWPQFSAPTWGATLGHIAKLTDGGLVVYGSFIAATLTMLLFVRQHQLPALAIADLLAPSLMLGLACGRLGCFLNGCCWGGLCENSALGVTFPQGSPPFVDQLENGVLLGMQLEPQPDGTVRVSRVQPGGMGDRAGLKAGDTIEHMAFPHESAFHRLRHGEAVDDASLSVSLSDGRRAGWQFGELPRRSMPVYPVQILGSLDAALICLFLWSYYPFRRRDGEVMALMLSIYPATRILLEMIRGGRVQRLGNGFQAHDLASHQRGAPGECRWAVGFRAAAVSGQLTAPENDRITGLVSGGSRPETGS